MKTIRDFLENNKKPYKLTYPDGFMKFFINNNKMYVKGYNSKEDITAIFSFIGECDLIDSCAEILKFEVRICDYCGCPMNKGYTDDDTDFYNCEECFPKNMDERYGKGNWRDYKSEDDDCNYKGGYYEYLNNNKWLPEPSYYTDWLYI